jgi:hypothetical protein
MRTLKRGYQLMFDGEGGKAHAAGAREDPAGAGACHKAIQRFNWASRPARSGAQKAGCCVCPQSRTELGWVVNP